ncbi:Protein kinase-like domain protein, partial [Metarhizium brunneum ARSEF 3297]
MSYNVVCTGRRAGKPDVVVSFREPEANLDKSMCQFAKAIHGYLVPRISHAGIVDGADPPLTIYTMPYLQGISCLDALTCQVEMGEVAEARHTCFIPCRHLARYFARCLSKPLHTTTEAQTETLDGIQRRLALVRSSSLSIFETPSWWELERSLPALFARHYPQVLTHGDLSRTNILVDEDTYEITGIVDWSLASILPFGMDLDCLFLTTGYMDRHGWHDYACRSRLHEAFWTEFWSASQVRDDVRQYKIRETAERVAKIGAILRYAFQRNADGSPSETLMSDGALTWSYLQAWLAT